MYTIVTVNIANVWETFEFTAQLNHIKLICLIEAPIATQQH